MGQTSTNQTHLPNRTATFFLLGNINLSSLSGITIRMDCAEITFPGFSYDVNVLVL